MTDHGRGPHRWANDLNKILAAAFRDDRFPVPVENIICEYSRLKFPASPVVAVEGRPLGTFEGALYPVQGMGRHLQQRGVRRAATVHDCT